MFTRKHRRHWIAAALGLVAFAAIALLTDAVFEHVPHSEDEVAYIFQANVFAQNRLWAPTPALDSAFWTPFVVDYQGRRFGKYPPGWPLLLSVGVRLSAPWLINAGLGLLTMALMARLGRCLHGPKVGLLAAGLGLVTPGFLFLSASLLSHAASLFWATLGLLLVQKLIRTRRPVYGLGAGLALGAAFVTRPFGAVGVGLPVAVFLLMLVFRGDLPALMLLWPAAGSLAVAGLLPLYWWAVTGDPAFNAYLLVWSYDKVGFGPDIGPYGYSLYEALALNTRLKLETLAAGLFGWPGWSNILFLPLPFVTRRATRWDWLLLGIIGGTVAVHSFYWAFGGADGGFPRYYYDALPALLLLTARGWLIAAGFLACFAKKRAWPALGWLPAGLAIFLVGTMLLVSLPPLLAAQKGKYGITPAPLKTVAQANLPAPALVLVKNVKSWSNFAALFTANSPTLDSPIVYAIDWGPDYTRHVRTQFKERSCWELDGPRLAPCNPSIN
jgi:4-amino-4-deoxy-L-arabinose transferase-like glycosyltransferase